MKQELDIVRRQVVRWARTPTFISAELLRKDSPSFREKLWVYQSMWAFPLLVFAFVLSILWAALPYTWHGAAITSAVVFGLWMLLDLVVMVHRLCGANDPLHRRGATMLSYKGLSKVVLFDRNRRRMPWHLDRYSRAKEADGKHPHLSVWIEQTNDGVQFHVLSHTRRHVGPWTVAKFEKGGQPASNWLKRPTPEEILDERERLEEFARTAETGMYGQVEESWAMRKSALMFRR